MLTYAILVQKHKQQNLFTCGQITKSGLPLNFRKKIQGYSRSFFENITVFQGSFEKIQGSKETGIQG